MQVTSGIFHSVYGLFDLWLDRPNSVRSNQALDRSTQVAEFGLPVDEKQGIFYMHVGANCNMYM